MKQKTQSISQIKPGLCKALDYFFTDIDDTLTTGGILPSESYAAIFALAQAGIKVVPVTGRPGGWCDMIARYWPVEAVIGENGAFYFSYDRHSKKMKRRYFFGDKEMDKARAALTEIEQQVREKIPRAKIAADQGFRLWDLAIDFKEDLPEPLSAEEIQSICRIFEDHGARYKVSSIHVNGWYGDFDKLGCVRRYLEDQAHQSWSDLRGKIIYIGDSLNDEPLFAGFDYSIGVANLKDFWGQLEYFPTYLTSRASGDGFVEAVKTILHYR
ncbi:MAG: HAD-IIB family hydrolase [Spirochaetales bacterium]|nr:HAD-IIB family hydrolase [Spirochaetales bacterium]